MGTEAAAATAFSYSLMQTARGSLSIKDLFVSLSTKHGHQAAQNNRDVGCGIVSLRVTAADDVGLLISAVG